MKKIKNFWLALLLSAAPLLAGLALYNRLPEVIPSHWGADGNIDGTMGKAAFVFGMGAFMIVMELFVAFALTNDPKQEKVSAVMKALGIWTIPVVSIFASVASYGTALGMNFDFTRIVMIFTGLLITVIGNYLPKCKQNYTVGIRTPWTLDDPENWEATHRLGGHLGVAGGLAATVLWLLNQLLLGFAVLLAAAFIPVIYSYIYYVKHKEEK